MRLRLGLIAAAIAMLGAASPQSQGQLEVQLQRAIQKEMTAGDLKAAIEEYKRIAASAGSNRVVAAEALLHLAEAYEKQGEDAARKTYERIVKEYGDQREPAGQARARLAALGGGASASKGVSMRQFFDPKSYPNHELWNVSADGRYAAGTDFTGGNAAIVDLASGKSWNVTDYGIWNDEKGYIDQSAISRDGKQIAFWRYNNEDGGQVRAVGADGKNERTLYKGSDQWGIVTDWSPDGSSIVVQLERGIKGSLSHGITDFVLVPAAGGPPRVLKTAEYTSRYRPKILFSPDGRYVAYDYPPNNRVAEGDIFVVPAKGGQEIAIAPHPAQEQLVGWTPNGGILFLSDRSGSFGLYRVSIKDGKQAGEPELLRSGLGKIFPLGVTKSGSLYYSQQVLATNAFIASLDFATGKLLSPPARVTQKLNDCTSTPSWSADGRKLAYVKLPQDGGAPTILLQPDGTADERELLPAVRLLLSGAGGHVFMVRWHADGRSLLGAGTKDNKHGLYRIDAGTGEASLVPEGMAMEWSPDGRWTFRAGGESRRSIVRKDTATGEEKIIYTPAVRWDFFRISPDGSRLAFLQAPADLNKGSWALSVISTDGGKASPLFARQATQAGFSWLAPAAFRKMQVLYQPVRCGGHEFVPRMAPRLR